MDIFDRLMLQREYASQLSGDLPLFKTISYSPFKAAFRCQLCGDSQKNARKCRGGIYERDYKLLYGCLNCGASMLFTRYMKENQPSMYKRYTFEVMKGVKGTSKPVYHPPKQVAEVSPLRNLTPMTLNARTFEYIKSRKIPKEHWDKLYYTPKFFEYVNSVLPGKFDVTEHDHERLVIPLFDFMGTCIGVQGRALDPSIENRYITIMFGEYLKFYGLERVNIKELVYVLEGPLDSLFLPNAIAMAGSDASPKNVVNNFVIVLDNEPRNKAVLQKYDKYITQGNKICIWPDSLKGKDINDMCLNGMSVQEILTIINKNTYSGIKAKLQLKKWKKV